MHLFDGSTLSGWAPTGNPESWSVDEGCIHCKALKGKYLYYTGKQFRDFVLTLEFKHTEKANSGVFFRWTDLENPVQTGIEIQILDTHGRDPATTHCSGAVYDLQAPTHNTCKPAGNWNAMTLYAKDNILRVTLNDEKIVDMDLNRWTTPGKNPDGSPNKFERPFCEMTEKGYLGLQDHGGLIWFRNLEIKEL